MTRRESAIQAEILLALSREFHPDGVFWRNNTGTGRSMDGQRVIKFGFPGSPDILGCLRGRWIGIEVKKPKGQQQENQRDFQAAIEQAGGLYIVARGAEEAICLLRAFVSSITF